MQHYSVSLAQKMLINFQELLVAFTRILEQWGIHWNPDQVLDISRSGVPDYLPAGHYSWHSIHIDSGRKQKKKDNWHLFVSVILFGCTWKSPIRLFLRLRVAGKLAAYGGVGDMSRSSCCHICLDQRLSPLRQLNPGNSRKPSITSAAGAVNGCNYSH